jgi:hypothetical protein
MSFIKNLFSKKSNSESSLEDIANDIFGGSYVISRSTIEDFSELNEEVSPHVHLLLCAGLIHLLDRHVFVIAPITRSNFMNKLINSVVTKYVSFYQNDKNSGISKDVFYDSILSQLNNYQTYFGQFKKLGIKSEDQDVKNTFNWEFGKIFSKELHKGDDPVFILLGSGALTDLLSSLSLIDKVSYLKNNG